MNSQVAQSYPNQPETPWALVKAVLREKIYILVDKTYSSHTMLGSQYLWETLLWSSAQQTLVLLLMRALHLCDSPEGHWSAVHPT